MFHITEESSLGELYKVIAINKRRVVLGEGRLGWVLGEGRLLR